MSSLKQDENTPKTNNIPQDTEASEKPFSSYLDTELQNIRNTEPVRKLNMDINIDLERN